MNDLLAKEVVVLSLVPGPRYLAFDDLGHADIMIILG